MHIAQPSKSGLGLKNGGIKNLNFTQLLDIFKPEDEASVNAIELKSIKIDDLEGFREEPFSNIRVSRSLGYFDINPTYVHLFAPVLGGIFSNNFDLKKAVSYFDFNFTEKEFGLKIGTPAFVFGSVVVDKVKKDVYFDQILGVFQNKRDFLNFLKKDVDSYSFTVFIFGSLTVVGSIFLFKSLFGVLRRKLRERSRRRE